MRRIDKEVLYQYVLSPVLEFGGIVAATMLNSAAWSSNEWMSLALIPAGIFSVGSRIKEFNRKGSLELEGAKAFVAGAALSIAINTARVLAEGGEASANLGGFEYAMLLLGSLEVGATYNRLKKKNGFYDAAKNENSLEKQIAHEDMIEIAYKESLKASRKKGSPFFFNRGSTLVVSGENIDGGKLHNRAMARWARELQDKFGDLGGDTDIYAGSPDWSYYCDVKVESGENLRISVTRPYQSDDVAVLRIKDGKKRSVQILVPGRFSNNRLVDMVTSIVAESKFAQSSNVVFTSLEETRDKIYRTDL